jgi:hypothetical protein
MRSLIIGALLAVAVSADALANYVFFFRPVGDWEIVCSRHIQTNERGCRLSAPRPSFSYRLAPNVIEVREWAPDRFQVIITVRDRVVKDFPLSLRVDNLEIHETPVKNGLAWWSDEEARTIILQMVAGMKVAYRTQTDPDGLPHDMRVSVATFRRALQIYRGVIRSHGLLKDPR